MNTTRPISILLVEDSPADVRLTMEALREAKLHNQIDVVEDGESAMEYLRRPGQKRPDLVLLDLNLPGMDGREVLQEIKTDPDLSIIPVVVLTTSSADEDVLRAYRLHTNCYITKPVNLDQFIRVVQSIQDFWLAVVRLPPTGNEG
ncbi:MAG TPA: response regulator [Polyangiaceae bacterium]|jgi:CheY-like chemotaxis protein|nr:response regulator [Polyangiaceae bacterium]